MQNPGQGIDPQIAAIIARATNTKGDYGKSDYNRMFDPMVGVLSNTYFQSAAAPELSEDELIYQYMPTYYSVKNSGYYDETSLEQSIISSVEDGIPLPKIKQMILNNLDSEGNTNELTSEEAMRMATAIDGEFHAYNVAVRKLQNKAPEKTIYEEAGLPNPEDPYDVDAMLQRGYQQIAESAKPYTINTQDTNRNKLFFDTQEKERLKAIAGKDAKQTAAINQRMRADVPYEYGGAPGITDLFVGMSREAGRDLNSKNLGGLLSYISGSSLLEGAGNVAGDFISRTARDVFTDSDGKKRSARESAYINEAEQNVLMGPKQDGREINQTTQMQRNAMGAMPKNYVPIRTGLVNRQREERAVADIQGMRELVARRLAASGNSPFNDAMVQRAIFLKNSGA